MDYIKIRIPINRTKSLHSLWREATPYYNHIILYYYNGGPNLEPQTPCFEAYRVFGQLNLGSFWAAFGQVHSVRLAWLNTALKNKLR